MKLFLVLLAALGANGLSCSYGGTEYPIGMTWNVVFEGLCATYECEKTGEYSTKSSVKSTECKDSDGNCQKVGNTGFPAVVEGTPYDNCECQPYGNDSGIISCSSGTGSSGGSALSCPYGGQTYPVGETWVVGCVAYVCIKTGERSTKAAIDNSVPPKCQDAEGDCYAIGEGGYSVAPGYNDCVCKPSGSSVISMCSG